MNISISASVSLQASCCLRSLACALAIALLVAFRSNMLPPRCGVDQACLDRNRNIIDVYGEDKCFFHGFWLGFLNLNYGVSSGKCGMISAPPPDSEGPVKRDDSVFPFF